MRSDLEIAQLAAFGKVTPFREVDGKTLYLVTACEMPSGCDPARGDVVVYPYQHGGYETRVFFESEVQEPKGKKRPNWHESARFLDRNWRTFSFKGVAASQPLGTILAAHLAGFLCT